MTHGIVWLRRGGQELGLVPTLGGAVAAWRCTAPDGSATDLWRPWDGVSEDLYQLASFAMLPWSNRIGDGGFDQDGQFHPVRPNRIGEPYPIHGDGWLQPWALQRTADDTLVMTLTSHRFGGNPYHYAASQTFRLVDGGLDQMVQVQHLGRSALPYGLGLHPWFVRTAQARLQAEVDGVWLSGKDPMPTAHTREFPESWDLNTGIPVHGSLIDNCFSQWQGRATVDWPERRLRLTMAMPDHARDGGAPAHFFLVYRPPEGPAFCAEPVTHPINAFHQPGRPGLRLLAPGERMHLAVQWRFAWT